MPRQMKKGGAVMVPMPMPARGWGDFVNDLKNFDFNRTKQWLGLKKGGKVAKPKATKRKTKK